MAKGWYYLVVGLKILLLKSDILLFWTYGCVIGVTKYPLLGVTALWNIHYLE